MNKQYHMPFHQWPIHSSAILMTLVVGLPTPRIIHLALAKNEPLSAFSLEEAAPSTDRLCPHASDTTAIDSMILAAWEQVDQAPLLEIHHVERADGNEPSQSVEQYIRPDRFRRIIFSPRYPYSEAPTAGIEEITVGDYIYRRIGDEVEQLQESPFLTHQSRDTDYRRYYEQATRSNIQTIGPESLENGLQTCVYAYDLTSIEEDNELFMTSSELLWIGVNDGAVHQWEVDRIYHTLNPPMPTESTLTFHYPSDLTIELPTESAFDQGKGTRQ